MDFDLDDALDSDDSFFEDPKAITKRSSLTKTPEKKSLDSLFGLGEKTATENVADASSKPKHSVKFEETVLKTESKKPKDDWLLDASPAPAEKTSKKTDFLEDILSVKPKAAKTEKKVASLEDILKESKVATAPKLSTSLKDINTSSKEASSDFGLFAPSASRERRRGRRGSASGLEDNLGLGLFTDDHQSGDFYAKDKRPTVSKAEDVQSKNKASSGTGMPDWLSGTTKSDTTFTEKSTTELQTPSDDKLIEKIAPKTIESTSSVAVEDYSTQLKPQQINMELQNTFASLHQQESLLLVSLQFKKYEEALKEIKHQQTEILGKQDKQFNAIIEEYVLKQQMVENNIRLQQERINNQIQMLMSSPMAATRMDHEGREKKEESREESEVSEIVGKMRQRHNEEMFMMEESYKKQIDIAEKSASALEEKIQNELKNVSNTFDEKLNTLKATYEEEIAHYKEKIKATEQQHVEEMKTLKENHKRLIEEMKMDHEAQIRYVKEMKEKENDLLHDGHVFSEKIDSGIELLTNSTKTLREIEEKVMYSHEVLTVAREKSVEAKEKEIILMRNALQKCRDSAENERAQLLSLVRNLEVKIAEQSANAQEDRWALQQAAATLTARAAALEREAEYGRNAIEREKEQLKTMKESLLAEQERILMQLTEEKLQISSEKARLETSAKLTNDYEVEKLKRESETAIQVAKQLTEKVNQERNSLHSHRAELEHLRRSLEDKERELTEKESEVDFLAQDAERKLRENKKVVGDARRMESLYKERLQELQNQWVSISNREKKLAEEKILLSKERLALYTSMKSSKGCVLCKPEGVLPFESSSVVNILEDASTKAIDAHTMRIRLEAIDDGESEVSKEDSHSAKVNMALI